MSYLDFVQKEPPKSGTTRSDQQDVEQAMQNFLKKEGKPFLFYSCYPHFRDQPSAGLRKPLPWKPTHLGGAGKSRQMVAPSTPTSFQSQSLNLSDNDEDGYPWSANEVMESSDNFHSDIDSMFADFRSDLQHQLLNGHQSQQDQHQQHSNVRQQQDHRSQQQQQLHQQPPPANSQNKFQSPTNQRQSGQHSQFRGQPQQFWQVMGPHQLFQSPGIQREPLSQNDPRSQFNSGPQQQQDHRLQFNSGQQQQRSLLQQQDQEPVSIPREVF